jgi:hypothetical protein
MRFSALCALLLLSAVSTFAQYRPLTGTVVDVDEGRNRLQIESDDDQVSRITVEADSVSTTFYGFGTVIAGKPEIFTGSSGFSNIRVGDRIEVRGTDRGNNLVRADRITLLGREIAAAPVGVGQTRNPNSVSTATDDRPTGTTTATTGTIEGTIRQINEKEGRIVIQTLDRRMLTVRTYRGTPVTYRGQTYQVANLDVGDRVRIDADPRNATRDEVTARRIEVTQSVQEGGSATNSGGVVTVLEGRVTRMETGLDYAYVDDGRGEVRVDMSQAQDARGDMMRARDLRVGDRVEIAGSYNRVGDMFLASTVRTSGTGGGTTGGGLGDAVTRYSIVTITATVTETLEDAATISLRDRDTNRVVRLWVSDDFIVRTKANTNTTASALRVNDTVIVKAFQDGSGNLIAQSVRLRNR